MLYKLEIDIAELSELWEVEIDVEIRERELEGERWHEVGEYKVIPNQELPRVALISKRIDAAFEKEKNNILNQFYDNLF
jgi:hypothetical protein